MKKYLLILTLFIITFSQSSIRKSQIAAVEMFLDSATTTDNVNSARTFVLQADSVVRLLKKAHLNGEEIAVNVAPNGEEPCYYIQYSNISKKLEEFFDLPLKYYRKIDTITGTTELCYYLTYLTQMNCSMDKFKKLILAGKNYPAYSGVTGLINIMPEFKNLWKGVFEERPRLFEFMDELRVASELNIISLIDEYIDVLSQDYAVELYSAFLPK